MKFLQAFVVSVLISILSLWVLPEILKLVTTPFEWFVNNSRLSGEDLVEANKEFARIKAPLLFLFKVGESIVIGSFIGMSVRQVLNYYNLKNGLVFVVMPPFVALVAWFVINRYSLSFMPKDTLVEIALLLCVICISSIYGCRSVQWSDWLSNTFNSKK
jgi:hypothetical protein